MSKMNKTKKKYLEAVGQRNEFLNQLPNKIVFSFRFFQSGKNSGQTFEDWEKEQYLADLNNKLKEFSAKNKQELLMDKRLEIYNNYPKDSKFDKPLALGDSNLRWARLRLTGERRLIGFFAPDGNNNENVADIGKNIFYIVFLDKNHEFAPYHKK